MLSLRHLQRLGRLYAPSASSSLLLPSLPSRSLHSSRWSYQSSPPATVKVSVNGTEVEVPSGFTVLQACESAGEHVPRFCYHDRLSIAGNCRMCLVEVEKSPKPVASCAFPLMANMKIKTDTPVVKKAREGVMEFLLANHPLDCPICDQGGECDLQDQSMYFGSDRSRFREMKRSVEDKNLGPLVKTVMTRCIHCTRCVRFTSEICGITTLGTTGRGNHMEIGTYVDQLLDTELSGNVIDLCPVGALTSKPYAFTSRPWELVRTESIDTMDAVGAAIRIDSRGPDVMRILPRLHEDVNEEWIGDKSRFSYDGLKRQRIDAPLVKQGDSFVPVSWSSALLTIRDRVAGLEGEQLLGVVGEQADAESIVALKDWLGSLGSRSVVTTQPYIPHSSDRSSYLFGSSIASIEYADTVLLLNCNPRMEAAVISSRLRKSVRQFGQRIFTLGPQMELNMPHTHLGDSLEQLAALTAASSSTSTAERSDEADEAREALRSAKQAMVIVGMGSFRDQQTANAVQAALHSLRAAFPSVAVNLLHTNASAVAALDLGVGASELPSNKSAKFVYLLGADNLEAVKPLIADNAFIVYSGSHGDVGASMADLVLPAPCYTEKNATYVNTEGRVQRTKAAVGRLAEAREEWQIIRALSELSGHPLPYHSLQQCRERLEQQAPSFKQLNTLSPSKQQPQQQQPRGADTEQRTSRSSTASSSSSSPPLQGALDNYFFTDPISRSSATMAKCSAQLLQARNSYKRSQHQAQHQAVEADKSERQAYLYGH